MRCGYVIRRYRPFGGGIVADDSKCSEDRVMSVLNKARRRYTIPQHIFIPPIFFLRVVDTDSSSFNTLPRRTCPCRFCETRNTKLDLCEESHHGIVKTTCDTRVACSQLIANAHWDTRRFSSDFKDAISTNGQAAPYTSPAKQLCAPSPLAIIVSLATFHEGRSSKHVRFDRDQTAYDHQQLFDAVFGPARSTKS